MISIDDISSPGRGRYSLDDKRAKLTDAQNDLPDLVHQWTKRDVKKKTLRSAQHFFVPVKEIRDNKYDLSFNRYRKVAHEEINHVPPRKLIAELTALETEIGRGLKELEGMLK